VAVDAAGNAYVIGEFQGTVDFDPGPGSVLLSSAGGSDVFVARYTAGGALVWARPLGGSGDDRGRAIALTADGELLIAGSFQGTADFDPSAAPAWITSAGGDDLFVGRLDAAGNLVWVRGVGGTGDEAGRGITAGPDGHVYVAGSFEGTVDFDPGPDAVVLAAAGPSAASDAFVYRLDASGGFVWARNMGGAGPDAARALVVFADGSVVVTGDFEGPADFDPGDGTHNLIGAGDSDGFVAKLDSAGSLLWAAAIGGPGDDVGTGVAATGDGWIYVAGKFQDTADFDPGAAPAPLTSAGGDDIFVARLDATGNFVWAVRQGGPGDDAAAGVALGTGGDVYAAGSFTGAADFDPGPEVLNVTGAGAQDAFVTRLDPTGQLVWARAFGGTGGDFVRGLAVAADDSVYTTGEFLGTADFAPAGTTFWLSSAGQSDSFVSRMMENLPPTDLTLSNANLPENRPVGTPIGTLSASDPNAGDALAYTLVDFAGYPDNAAFGIAGNQLQTAAMFDYEARTTYRIRVRAADPAGLWCEATFTITINDVDEIPPTVSGMLPSLAGGRLNAGTRTIEITFGEVVTGAGTPGHFVLRSLGPDALLGTADDDIHALAASWSDRTTTLRVPALIPSVYRLTVRDAIADPTGNALDGDGDGLPGGDWVRDFVVTRVDDSLFHNTPTFGTGSDRPAAIAGGDFNLDGKPDLAVATSFLTAILLGDGLGGFATVKTFAHGVGWATSIASGDLNGDGRPDLVVGGDTTAGKVGVILGDGAGGFGAPVTFASGGSMPQSLAVADFNADGRLDLAVANKESRDVGVLLGDGSGGFAAAAIWSAGSGKAMSVATGDFNMDGKVDLAIAGDTGSVVVRFGDGIGGFASSTSFSSGGSVPGCVAVEDFNGDGKSDLAVANYSSADVGILLGNGVGGFSPAVTFAAGGLRPYHVSVSDVNGDGKLDLTVVNYYASNVGVLLGDGAGAFSAVRTWGTGGTDPYAAAIGDFDADGRADIAVVNWDNYNVGILFGDGAGDFGANRTFGPGGTYPQSVAVGDFNADGRADVAVANPASGGMGNVGLLLGDGAGGLAGARTFLSGGSAPYSLAAADFNADGRLDLIVANASPSHSLGLLLGGAGGLGSARTFGSGGDNPLFVAVGDFNNDGHPDVAVTNWDSDNVGILLGDGAGNLSAAQTFSSGGSHPRSLAVGDFNGDGKADLAVGNEWARNVGILLGNGAGAFSLAATLSTPGSDPESLAVGDFNADGKADLVVAKYATGENLAVFYGNGAGGFSALTAFRSGGSYPDSIAMGDFNGDGMPDLAAANRGSDSLGILLADGVGGFLPASVYHAEGDAPAALAVGDLDADGQPDVVIANRETYTIALLRNTLAPPPWPLTSANTLVFDVQPRGFGAGQLVQGPQNAFDGLNRLQVGGADYRPDAIEALADGGRTLVTAPQTLAGLRVHRRITVPSVGAEDFVRTVEVFSNPTGSPITTTVRIVGNLGSDAATTVWKTSDGDTAIEITDQWIGTDADGSGAPAIVHYLRGPFGLQPQTVATTGDNLEWTYAVTVPAGATVRLAHFTIVSESRAAAEAAAGALVTTGSFGGQAAAFLTSDEAASLANFQFSVSRITDRHIFYNNSFYDGNDPAADTNDFSAVAPHAPLAGGHGPHPTGRDQPALALGKNTLLPGQTATFANYTSYSRGINGVMIDIAGLRGTPTAADFEFHIGNDNDPAAWPAAPAPVGIRVFPGAGTPDAEGAPSDRITIIWADNAIQNTWLQITVLATAATGLDSPDVFYFGNAIGDSGSGNVSLFAFVTVSDELAARSYPHNFQNPAPITDPCDFNKDRFVTVSDELVARNHGMNFLNALRMITVPGLPAGGTPVGAAAGGESEGSPRLAEKTDDWEDLLSLLSGPRSTEMLHSLDALFAEL